MKILFSADWHLKLGQKNVPRDWQKNRYNMLFDKIHALEEVCDVHILGGDVFDTIPKPEELGMYFEFIRDCTIPTLIYDGNHEATKKGHTFFEYLANASYSINRNVEVLLGSQYGLFDGLIDVIPYTELKTFNPADFNSRILCTHVRGAIPPHVIPEVDLDKFNRWDTVLAGDLHSHENSQGNIIYPGSPLTISFHRNKVSNGVIIFDTDTMTHEFISLDLPQLIRKTIQHEEEIVKHNYDHVIYEVTGNVLELSGIASELIDKKIIKTNNEAQLNLANLSIEGELELYFTNILELSKEDISKTMRVFNDFHKEFGLE